MNTHGNIETVETNTLIVRLEGLSLPVVKA